MSLILESLSSKFKEFIEILLLEKYVKEQELEFDCDVESNNLNIDQTLLENVIQICSSNKIEIAINKFNNFEYEFCQTDFKDSNIENNGNFAMEQIINTT